MARLNPNKIVHPFPGAPTKVLAIVTVDIMAWVLLRQWLEGLQQAGFEVHIACSKGIYFDQLAGAGFIMHPVRLKRTFNPVSHIVPLIELLTLLRTGQFQVVNTHSPVAAAVGRFAAALAGVQTIIYTVHGFYFHDRMPALQRKAFVAFEWLLGRWTDAFMFVSDEDRRTAQESGICGVNARVCTIYNGVDLDLFHPRPPAPANEAPATALRLQHSLTDRPVVGCVGRIVKDKGYREFLEAATNLTAAGFDATWMIVGDSLPSDRDQFGPTLREQVRKAGLADRFVFTGMTPLVADYLALMDIFVLPSYREGFPRSILEAMSTGLPVVATDIRGCREAVLEGVTGFIVPPRDGKALAEAIKRLLVDPALRQKMGREARSVVTEKYDFRKVREKFVGFVIDVVSQDRLIHVHPPARPGARRASLSLAASTVLAVAVALYILPGLVSTWLAAHFQQPWPVILAGDAVGCVAIAFIAGWRRAAILYWGLSLFEWLLASVGRWPVTRIIWFSNLIPAILVAVWLVPLILQARNWRRDAQQSNSQSVPDTPSVIPPA